MLVSFFKTPTHKRFQYRPLYAKDSDSVLDTKASPGSGDSNVKSIRFRRRNSTLQPSNRYDGIQRIVLVLGLVWGLTWVFFGQGSLRWLGLAFPVLVWLRWRKRGSSTPS
jgi:hypothetical protein